MKLLIFNIGTHFCHKDMKGNYQGHFYRSYAIGYYKNGLQIRKWNFITNRQINIYFL